MQHSKHNSIKKAFQDIFKTNVIKGSKLLFVVAKIILYIGIQLPQWKKYTNRILYGFPKEHPLLIKNTIGIFEIFLDDETLSLSSPFYEYFYHDWLNSKDNEIFIDIGANIGFYTILAARKARYKKIYSFEADPGNFTLLKNQIYLNKLQNYVMPLNIALGATSAELLFAKNKLNIGMCKFIDNQSLKEINREQYEVIKLRTSPFDKVVNIIGIIPNDIGFIKIDVEGFEHNILQGMSRTLEKTKKGTKIFIEIWEKNTLKEETIKILKKHNFVVKKKIYDNYLFERQ